MLFMLIEFALRDSFRRSLEMMWTVLRVLSLPSQRMLQRQCSGGRLRKKGYHTLLSLATSLLATSSLLWHSLVLLLLHVIK